jgi:hypothetical protein
VKSEMSAAYDPDGATDFARMLTLVNTDKVWAEPARFTARSFATKGTPAYIYLFSYVSPSMQGVTIQVFREDNGADGCTHGCTQTELAEGLSRLETS